MLAPGEATNRIIYDEQICYEHRFGTFVSRDYLIIFFLDAKKVDSLNTLEKLIEHHVDSEHSRKWNRQTSRLPIRTMLSCTSNKKFNKITAIQKTIFKQLIHRQLFKTATQAKYADLIGILGFI